MKKLLLSAIATAILISVGQNASAHISYSGRNFGTLQVGGAAVVIGTQTISSSFGWADATDTDWGDSHRGRFFRFTLNSTASVIITVSRNHLGNQTTGNGTANSFLPAVSLYSGLAQRANNEGVQQGATFRTEALAHDGSALSISARGSAEGSLRTLTNFSIGNDDTYVTSGDPTNGILIPARLASFTYIGHAADGTALNYGNATNIEGDGTADGFLTATFLDLAPGDYSFFVGGADYAAQEVQVGTYPTYGVFVSAQAIEINGSPVITSANSASGKLKRLFSYRVVASNKPTRFTATGLPDGLSINRNTGIIKGRLTQSGTFTVRITAENEYGITSKDISIIIAN
jgi:hypothetical protein